MTLFSFVIDYFFFVVYTLYIVYDRGGSVFDNKLLVDVYVLSLDKHFEIFIPVDEKVGNVIKLLNKTLSDSSIGCISGTLLNLYSGSIYKNNDIIRDTDIQNQTKLILI